MLKGLEVSILCEELTVQVRFARTGLQVCGAPLAAFCKVEGNGGLCVRAGTSQFCRLSLCLSCQTHGKAPFTSSVSFSAKLGGLERDQCPNHCVNQSSTSDKQILCFPFFLFLFCLPGRIFKTTEAKAQVTFCFQAHPVPSQGKEKSTEQHLLIKSLFSSPCLFLTQGSANWCPHSADQRGKWGLQQRTVKRSALPECRGKLHYFWMSGPEHSGDSLPYFPLWIGDCPPAHSCLGHPSSQGASSGGNGASAFTSFEWAVFGWLSWYSDSYLRRRQVSHFLAAQGENFGNILNSFLPHVPLPVHQHIVLAPHSKVSLYL